MKTPNFVIIKGEKWRISWRKKLIGEKNEELWGDCDYEKRIIRLSKAQPDNMKLSTLIHELTHAGLHELHVDISSDLNEVICDGLGYIFSQILTKSKLL